MEQEQAHFLSCQEFIRQNISYYEQKAAAAKKETEELYAALTAGDTELYNQLIVSRDMQEHNENQLRKNKAALEKPYFGRVDYTEIEDNQKESLYIGKNGVTRNKTEVLIIDWRAPVSALYYENELGKGSYRVPDIGEISVELGLKRTFDIGGGKLLGYFDNDTAATDELLVKYLSQNKEVILGDIISTIQKEQNEIIRQSPFCHVIVQGVAGSGKTTVAMHRISYILYNYEKRFSPSEFCIIGSNDMLLHYITSGLPELDVHHASQKRMDLFFVELLGKEWKKKYKLVELTDEEAFKSTLSFGKELDTYLQNIRENLLLGVSVKDKSLGVILSKESIAGTLFENANASIFQIYKLLNERIRTRIKFLTDEEGSDYCKEKIREYRGYFSQTAGQKDIVKIYQDFIAWYGIQHGIELVSAQSRISQAEFDVYDVAALALIQKRMTEKSLHDEYGQIMVDEAQDFGVMVYYVLKQVLGQCCFTIMGDVSQNIHYHTGMNDWEDLKCNVFEPERTRFHILSKSYRNTIEISQYAGRILEHASVGQYKIQPVIRHGRAVEFYQVKTAKMGIKTTALINEIQARGYGTIAVICRNQTETEIVERLLGAYVKLENGAVMDFHQGVMVLPIQLTKGLEFDGVILWNPNEQAYQKTRGDAKLLYVAVTRALHELHVVYQEKLSPLFLA